jgi:MFS transporter, MCT family, solute carrier family 16 (monocarboxylic acid transporters), member 10
MASTRRPSTPEKEKEEEEQYRTDSTTTYATIRPEMYRRNSLASLSVAAEPRQPGEPTWPRGWRPYVTLFGGFLLMFNSWGIVRLPPPILHDVRW